MLRPASSPSTWTFALGLAATALLVAAPAVSQNVPSGLVSVNGTEIRIDGLIDQAVADRFSRQIQTSPGLEKVSLNSPGGRAFPALDIARSVKRAGLKTSVPMGDKCLSACSFIFLAGQQRIADGQLGVHQISGVNDPSLTQTAIGKIYEELVGFNTPSHLVARMLRTPPDSMYMFTSEELERHKINIRGSETRDGSVPHLQVLESWTRDDWLVGAFLNTNTNKPFIAIESRDMTPLMRIAHYPHRSHTFVEFMLPGGSLAGTKSRIELRFSQSNNQPLSLSVDADMEPNSYSFDMPRDQTNASIFWAAFTTSSHLTVLNGYGVEIGRFSLKGSRRAVADFIAVGNRIGSRQ